MKMQPLNKKGQAVTLTNIGTIIAIIGVAAITAVIVSILITQLQTDQRTTLSTLVSNETNGTASSVLTNVTIDLGSSQQNANRIGYSLSSEDFSAINASDDCTVGSGCEDITIGNFTVHSNGTVDLITTEYTNTQMNFTYTFRFINLDAVENFSAGTLSFYDNLSDQFALIGTVIGLVLVVSIIMAAFAFTRRRDNL